MEKSEKVWETPYLVVLSRGTPDENVLTHCKRIGFVDGESPLPGEPTPATAYSTVQTGCDAGAPKNCGNCAARSGS